MPEKVLDPLKLKNDQEQFDEFWSCVAKAPRIQYDYRSKDGKLFSCIAVTLEQARRRRDDWLAGLPTAKKAA